MTKPLWKTGALSIAASMMLSFLAPVAVAAPVAESTPYIPEIQNTPQSTYFGSFNRLPDVEPGVVGTIPASGTALQVAGLKDGSALVRLSAFGGEKAVELSAAGTPVLKLAQGHEGSTTILVPVHNGQIPVTSSAKASVRVEVLASYASDDQTPGATLALAQPVTRADSANDLGLKALSSDPKALSVVGIGGVPSQDVRAVYVTANLQLDSAGIVTLSGQELHLPAGQSIVTTIALVDETGAVEVSSNAPGNVRLDVTGWVVGASQNMSSANATGGYVPAAGAQWNQAKVSQDKPASIDVTGHSGRQKALALVSADSSDTATRSFINVGDEAKGRSRGILVDPSIGALPQIEVVEVSAEDAAISVQGGAVDANVLALGDIIGEPISGEGHTSVEINAPAAVDLGTEGEILLQGSITSNAPVDKVDLFGNGTYIGTAAVNYTVSGATWNFHTAAPESGETTFSAEAVARDGSKATAKAQVEVTVPEADVTVVAPDVVILDTEEIRGYDEGTFIFESPQGIIPGDVLVAGSSTQTPDGALGRVLSIQQTPDGWEVKTEEATLTQVFLQANDESSMPAFAEGTELIAPEGDQGFEVIDEGVPNAELIPVKETTPESASARSLLTPSAASDVESSRELTYTLTGKAELAFTKEKNTDLSFATADSKKKVIHKVKSSGGISFVGKVEVSLAMETGLGIDIQWSWGIPSAHLSHFKSVFKGSFEAGYEASISGSYEEKLRYEIAKFKGAPLTVMIGPVPVVFRPGATLAAIGELKGDVNFSYADSFNPGFQYGVEYKDGSWNPVRNPAQGDPTEPAQCVGWGSRVNASGNVSGQGGLQLDAEVKLYGIAGPKAIVSAQGKSAFGLKYDGAEDMLTASASQDLVVSGALNIDAKFKVLGVEIGDEWQMAKIERVFKLSEDLPIQLDLCADEDTGEGDGDGDGDGEDTEEAAESTLTGKVVDATTNEPIAGVQLRFEDGQGETHTASSDSDGNYSVTLGYGQVSISAQPDGYIAYTRTVGVPEGETMTHDIQLSKELESTQYRAVLTWGAEPTDLDSHLIGADLDSYYHIYYGEQQALDTNYEEVIAELDIDDVTSYGPETTTFDVTGTGEYTFFVHNYSGAPELVDSDAHVTLYQGNNKIADYDVPTRGEGLYWNVFQIRNGELSTINSMSDEPGAAGSASMSRRMADTGSITNEQLAEVQRETEAGDK